MAETLFIIDGHAQIYRSYYAPFRPLTSPSGEPTRATYVFFSTLFNLIREHQPDYLVMALDVSDKTVFRCDIYPEYKAHRDPPPEDLPVQVDRIIQIVEAMGIPILRKEGFEADDLMATLAERFADDPIDICLVSRDKDLEQLITDRLYLFDPHKNERIDRAVLLEKKGYAPEKAVEIQTLTGDTTDNIPGVPGIGPKTAVKLIERFGSAEAVLAHADELTPKQCENVKAFAEQMPITRELVTLRRDVAFPFDLDEARWQGVPVEKVRPIFVELDFHRLTEQLETFAAGEVPVEPVAVETVGEADYQLVDTEASLMRLAKSLASCSAFAVDTETTSLNAVDARIVGISIAWEAGTAFYVPIRAAVGTTLPIDTVKAHLGPIFADAGIAKVGQNIKYDLIILRQAGLPLAGVSFDTMIASFVLEPLRRSHGIDGMVLELFGHRMIPISELIGKGKQQIGIDEVPADLVCTYASEDADYTWRLYEAFGPQIESSPTRSLFVDTEMPLVDVLTEMELNGVALDAGLLAAMANELADRLIDLRKRVHAEAGHEFNIDSTKQLAAVLFDELNLPVIRKTKTGRSTDADTLNALASQTDHPITRLMVEYRELSKLKSTYLDTLPGMVSPNTGRIHASFHQTGAVTGRLSSSDPNLQNIPVRTELGRRIRGAFVAGSDDTTLIVADYSQIELRVLAHFSSDEALLEAFRQGQDIHASVAAQVNGVALADVTSEQRSAAKAVNFGLIYGQTAFGLARGLGIPRADAQDFIDRYYARYAGIRGFIDTCIQKARATGYAETMLGRRRPIPELNSRNRQQQGLGERLAVNTVVQGTAADLIKRAMIDLHRSIKAERLDLRMLIQVHDELVFESPQSEVDAHSRLIEEKMTHALPLDVLIVVDIGVGRSWLDAK